MEAQHQAATEFARARLLPYALALFPAYRVAPHLRRLAHALEAVEAGRMKRLIVCMPPRHGKSELASSLFPAWYMGRNPERQIITATYAQDLADDFGRKVRNHLREPFHVATFGSRGSLRRDSTSVKRFHTQAGGVYQAVGAGGPITGRGAHLMVIDDPTKGREQAESPLQRRRLQEWYSSVAYTRLMPDGAIVLIQTRWHTEDLAGWVQEEHRHEGWHVISMEALDEERDIPLWPEQYPLDELKRIRETIGPRDWSALYQQRPVPRGGNLFKRTWFRILQAAPSRDQIQALCRYWDKAATEGGGDYTAGVLVARLRDNRYALLDVVRGQWSPGTREANILQTAQLDAITYGPQAVQIVLEQEGGSAGKSDASASIKALAGHRVEAEHPTGSKEVRAQPLANQAEAGNVDLVAGPWNKAFLDEVEAFPQGKHDDQVDAASGAFNRVALAAGRPRVIAL